MSPSPADDSASGPHTDSIQSSRSSLRDRIVSSLQTVAEAETHGPQRRTGSIGRGRSTLSYDYTVSVGLTSTEEPTTGAETAEDSPTPTNSADTSTRSASNQRIETRRYEDGSCALVVDLPDTTESTISAVVDDEGSAIRLLIDGEVADRISVDPEDTNITDATVANGTLTVRLSQTDTP